MSRWLKLSVVALLLSGCEPSRCDVAVDEINAMGDDCLVVTGLQDASLDCTDADAEELERHSACMEEASCSAIDGSDPAAHRALSECVAGLTDPAAEEDETTEGE